MAGFAALLLKNTVGNMVAGAMFMFGNDFNVDDIVYIGGKTKARITRISLQKTTFHIIETDRKLIIPNTSLYGLKCEKVLPQNGGPKRGIPAQFADLTVQLLNVRPRGRTFCLRTLSTRTISLSFLCVNLPLIIALGLTSYKSFIIP